ncbi:hypothetical protein GCM10023084_20900 [Streptomyces lacrimifluminis]|uniref:Uncharacterized protein n=1 Tax=Streptomyces lacrimifluminis TaxID=1500077 RepID=A0A917KY28_9ACTN|nr:hypothetical protein [Streptomyces lacrimifluminis]GGJ35301.1 hypothetical protein GCM10012282_35110 [Streptomyces lacrimifluminis]
MLPLCGGVTVAGGRQALLLVEVALHPHRGVEPRGELLADDARALDPDDVGTGGDGDRSWPAMGDPGVGAEVHRGTPVQGAQDVLDEHGRPVEAGVVPGDVVGVHDGGAGHDVAQTLGQGRPAGTAPPVDRDHLRAPGGIGRGVAQLPDGIEQGHHPMADGLGLTWSQTHRHPASTPRNRRRDWHSA